MNSLPVLVVVLGMEPIQDVHVARPGLVVVDIAAADDATALALQAAIAGRWATATADRTTRDPGQAGVRLRLYADLEQNVADDGAQSGRAGRRQAPAPGSEAVGHPAGPSLCPGSGRGVEEADGLGDQQSVCARGLKLPPIDDGASTAAEESASNG
ncbi:DUF6207 family protein [Streptomyces stelliscabiei]|uniref:DUF6207 family protein n=2 Tax=Streptomyces stelliscabiei TaxID=146820 RepID=UPI0029BF8BFF|nr:DUF6207 family protein [Streptomyces stelliscabiei]MDX2665116.1 DUF6207 family protein [Streptomyces stelliscabiei]MDX2793307.1 DUF6207 family protein [Streptomyces stelliscabiei]MDX3442183.1 DUF6207 family protein [Streptomyces stelliscabiei]MDX3627956.1 DUF6207 family protein [Streptomyces stelliscabiei]